MFACKQRCRPRQAWILFLTSLLLVTMIYAFYRDSTVPKQWVRSARGRFVRNFQVDGDDKFQDQKAGNWTYSPDDMGDIYRDSTVPQQVVRTARDRFVQYSQVGDNVNGLEAENGTYSPGDMGKPVVIENAKDPDIKKQIDAGWALTGLNQYASDLMSVFRRLPDFRADWCKQPGRFLSELPPTSVVIIFFNEAWSVLVRTVHSVLNRSPPELVEEIILVDDGSTLVHLKTQLYDYFRPYEKVKIIRTGERIGLIRAKILGAKSAKAEIVTFLDAHCEVTTGWLEAQLDPVARDPKTIAIPSIDLISRESMVPYVAEIYYGTFDWALNFQWKSRMWRKKKHENPVEPFETPVMPGGAFSINKTFFAYLGWYDEEFTTYGGEHLELSFKAWMCGGSMQIVPCSRVTHIQKRSHPYINSSPGGTNFVRRNKVRLAEVWMDEYAQFYYDSIGGPKNRGDFGDISARKRLREQLNCKSFRWYMENVFPEKLDPSRAIGSGEIRTETSTNKCLEYPLPGNQIGINKCRGKGGSQCWFFTAEGEITRDDHCLDWNGSNLTMLRCPKIKSINQLWAYEANQKMFRHVKFFACLQLDGKSLKMNSCDTSNANQKWVMQHYNASNLKYN